MAEIEGNFWRSSGPNPLRRQSQLEPVAQDQVQMAFEYLKVWRLCNISGQPLPMIGHPRSKKVLPDVPTDPPVVSVCAL